ncbi:MAG: histidine kinase [Chloroflexi bacterium]|nr:histidine kinase [Chloroflexota bacterium]
MDQEQHAEDFFLPDLCEAQSILFLILVTELLVFVLVLADSELIDFNWVQLGLTSLFVQWIVLTSAGILCHFRPILMRLSVAAATTICYGLILSMTFGFSLLGEWLFLPEVGGWSVEALGRTGRNLLIASVMTGIAFRYFYLQHQFRRQEQAELNSRIQALQSRIRPHFLFNSMNIIASLISVDPAMAEEVVEDLSLLFRASLNDTSDKPVLLSEFVKLVEQTVGGTTNLERAPMPAADVAQTFRDWEGQVFDSTKDGDTTQVDYDLWYPFQWYVRDKSDEGTLRFTCFKEEGEDGWTPSCSPVSETAELGAAALLLTAQHEGKDAKLLETYEKSGPLKNLLWFPESYRRPGENRQGEPLLEELAKDLQFFRDAASSRETWRRAIDYILFRDLQREWYSSEYYSYIR